MEDVFRLLTDGLLARAGMLPNGLVEDIIFRVILLVVFSIGFTWADRYGGAPNRKGDAKLLTFFLGTFAWIVGGGYAFLGVLAWSLYRFALGFGGGAAAPVNEEQRRNTVVRHIVIVPVFVALSGLWAGWGMKNLITMALVFSAYAIIAISMGWAYGKKLIRAQANNLDLGKYNMELERERGMFFGIVFAGWIPAMQAAVERAAI